MRQDIAQTTLPGSRVVCSFGRNRELPRNLRPVAASLFLLAPGEGGPKGRMRERGRSVPRHNPRAMGPSGLSSSPIHLSESSNHAPGSGFRARGPPSINAQCVRSQVPSRPSLSCGDDRFNRRTDWRNPPLLLTPDPSYVLTVPPKGRDFSLFAKSCPYLATHFALPGRVDAYHIFISLCIFSQLFLWHGLCLVDQ